MSTECIHEWQYKDLKEKEFGIIFGSIRKCKKCNKEQHADHTAGRLGGGWKDIEAGTYDKVP